MLDAKFTCVSHSLNVTLLTQQHFLFEHVIVLLHIA